MGAKRSSGFIKGNQQTLAEYSIDKTDKDIAMYK
jgi:hypothetical protein